MLVFTRIIKELKRGGWRRQNGCPTGYRYLIIVNNSKYT